jgi:hypothetical protein
MKVRITRRSGLIVGIAAALALGGAGAAIASADDDANDRPITGAELERATEAALAETGGGRVTATEVGDEESLYEVEVTLDSGEQVDVQLDEDFVVVGTEGETEPEDES